MEDLVFGSDDDEDESVLFHPTSVCVDGEGSVYFLPVVIRYRPQAAKAATTP